ncbi:MAG: glycosyltransferase [Peptococcaceae bacterium]|nr:glycosyltransferase [Peptococcaceae bacterium]
MRIMIVTEVFLPATDGLVLRLTEAIRYFQKNGHQVVVVTPYKGIDSFEGAKVYGISNKKFPIGKELFWRPSLKKIYELMESFEPQVVHIANPVIMGKFAFQYAHSLGIPVVVSYHTNYERCLKKYRLDRPMAKKWVWKMRREISSAAALNLCTSYAMAQSLKSYGINNVHVLNRGVDLDKRHPRFASEDMRMILSRGKTDKKLLVFVGSLLKRKNLEALLPMMRRRDDVCLAIVGDGEYRQVLEQAFSGTDTVFTGYLTGKNLSEAYASGDAFIFPTVDEQVGLPLLEAMASGVPILAARSPLTIEQFCDGCDALFFNIGDEDALDEVIGCLDDKETMKKMALIARHEAESNSWEGASQQLLDYYSIAFTRASHYN